MIFVHLKQTVCYKNLDKLFIMHKKYELPMENGLDNLLVPSLEDLLKKI